MIVVSDTSAVTSLIQIGRAEILQKLFEKVVIPPAVRAELLSFHSSLPIFLQTVAIKNHPSAAEFPLELGAGEIEAITLAQDIRPDFLLIDDGEARRAALSRGLPVIGLLGVLMKAKRQKVFHLVAPIIRDLETIAGFRISIELKREVLRSAGEGDDQ